VIHASAIVPAAGKGERFSRSAGNTAEAAHARGTTRTKMLADVGGQPMLNRTVRCLLDGGVAEVVVVLSPAMEGAMTSVALLADARVRIAVNPDPSRGMFSSIQIGMAATTGDPILVLPGDMPFVKAETVAALLAAHARDPRLISPQCDGRRGHPIVLPAPLRSIITTVDPHHELSTFLAPLKASRLIVNVDDRGILRDVDFVKDLT
jgi:molybdenum cofactor cytidylyltransferase